MKTNNFQVEARPISLYVLSDTHIGNINTNINYLKNIIKQVASEPDSYILGLGDWVEGITPADPRFELESVDKKMLDGNLIFNQYDLIERLFSQVGDKIIGLHTGNHDDKLTKKFCTDFVKIMCARLDVPYLEWSALTRLQFVRENRKTSFIIYSTHGSVAGRKRGNKINRMEDVASSFEADIYLAGHSHDLFYTYQTQFYLDKKNNLKTQLKLFGHTGCFLEGITQDTISYAEKMNLPPNRCGCLKINFYPELDCFDCQEIMMNTFKTN